MEKVEDIKDKVTLEPISEIPEHLMGSFNASVGGFVMPTRPQRTGVRLGEDFIGFLIHTEKPKYHALYAIYLLDQYQNHGIGIKMMEWFIKQAKDNGMKEVHVVDSIAGSDKLIIQNQDRWRESGLVTRAEYMPHDEALDNAEWVITLGT